MLTMFAVVVGVDEVGDWRWEIFLLQSKFVKEAWLVGEITKRLVRQDLITLCVPVFVLWIAILSGGSILRSELFGMPQQRQKHCQ
jgi:hypothetical protein